MTSELERRLRDALVLQAEKAHHSDDLAAAARAHATHHSRRRRLQAVGVVTATAAVALSGAWLVPSLINGDSADGPRSAPATRDAPPETTPPPRLGPVPDALLSTWAFVNVDGQRDPLLYGFVTITDAQIRVSVAGCGAISGSVGGGSGNVLEAEFSVEVPRCSTTIADGQPDPPTFETVVSGLEAKPRFSVTPEELTLTADGTEVLRLHRSKKAANTVLHTPPSGPPNRPVIIPDVVGLDSAEAVAAILEAGAPVGEVAITVERGPGAKPLEVVGVSPAVGAPLPVGQVAQLFVFEGPYIEQRSGTN